MGNLGATPKNQLDALPLKTASGSIAPTTLIQTGQRLTAYWSPGATGINGVNYAADPNDAALGALFTNFLPFGGFTAFAALLVVTQTAGALDVGIAHSAIPQYRGGGSIPPQSGNAIGGSMFSQAKALTPNWAALGLPASLVIALTWDNRVFSATPPVAIGQDCRIWFRRGAVPKANQTYACHLWAEQS